MHPALARLAERRPLDGAAVDAFLSGREVPLRGERSATFLYRGEAEAVRLRHWLHGLPPTRPFRRLEDTDLWWSEMEIPRRSRIEYKIEVEAGGETRLLRDPLNPLEAHDPFGSNSVFQATGYETPDWVRPHPQARRGEIREMTVASRAFGGRRRVLVYLPARRRHTRRYPLLVVHDGEDFLRYADLQTVLDNLIEGHQVAPLVVALTQTPERLTEYAGDPRHARFVCRELPAALARELPLEPDPVHRGLAGASLGAVASLSAAWLHPGAVGRLLLQSGSFAFTGIGRHGRGEVFDPVVALMDRLRCGPGRPAERIFVSCGVYESLIHENRSLIPVLHSTGAEVRWREARDGHNWQNWRDRLGEALSWLFPGPRWNE